MLNYCDFRYVGAAASHVTKHPNVAESRLRLSSTPDWRCNWKASCQRADKVQAELSCERSENGTAMLKSATRQAGGEPPSFDGRRHDKAKTLTGTKPIETGNGYSVTEVILCDNVLDTPISGSSSTS